MLKYRVYENRENGTQVTSGGKMDGSDGLGNGSKTASVKVDTNFQIETGQVRLIQNTFVESF